MADFPDLACPYHDALAQLRALRRELERRLATSTENGLVAACGRSRVSVSAAALESLVDGCKCYGGSVEALLCAIDIEQVEAALAELALAGPNVDADGAAAALEPHAQHQPPESNAPSAAGAAPTRATLPRLVMAVGLPGSGKSTFAEALVASGNGWQRVCQDVLGSRREVRRYSTSVVCVCVCLCVV